MMIFIPFPVVLRLLGLRLFTMVVNIRKCTYGCLSVDLFLSPDWMFSVCLLESGLQTLFTE